MNIKRLSITGIVVGAMLALGPLWGSFLTGLTMARAFNSLGKAGISDPRQVSLEIGNSLMAAGLGLLICPIGICLLIISIVALVRSKRQAPPSLPMQTL